MSAEFINMQYLFLVLFFKLEHVAEAKVKDDAWDIREVLPTSLPSSLLFFLRPSLVCNIIE